MTHRPVDRQFGLEMQEALHAELGAALERSPTGDEFNMLALSGGGQFGAFGAGFLMGWTERKTPPTRPASFNVVTGTSTGALIATFAFLGSSYDAAVRDAYFAIRGDRDVYVNRWKVALLWSDSVASTRPFRRLIEKHVTPEMVGLVAQEYAKGRLLFVGATDLESGQFHCWNLTRIAGATDVACRRYIDALMSSVAYPVLFPPVSLRRAKRESPIMYVDGGIRRNVFFDMLARQMELRRGKGDRIPGRRRVYCLVNGTRDVSPWVYEGGLLPVLKIAGRSADVLLAESTEGNLFRVYLRSGEAGFRFNVASITPSMAGKCLGPGSQQDVHFDPAVMRCLHAEALLLARDDPEPWQEDPLKGSP